MNTLAKHTLYHRSYCPYCLKVRAAMITLKIDMELINVSTNKKAHATLLSEGGQSMVPCLRIEHDDGSVEWMYESNDIIRYLKKIGAK